MVSGYSGFFNQLNLPPRYDWNIVESGVKHYKQNQIKNSRIKYTTLLIFVTYKNEEEKKLKQNTKQKAWNDTIQSL